MCVFRDGTNPSPKCAAVKHFDGALHQSTCDDCLLQDPRVQRQELLARFPGLESHLTQDFFAALDRASKLVGSRGVAVAAACSAPHQFARVAVSSDNLFKAIRKLRDIL